MYIRSTYFGLEGIQVELLVAATAGVGAMHIRVPVSRFWWYVSWDSESLTRCLVVLWCSRRVRDSVEVSMEAGLQPNMCPVRLTMNSCYHAVNHLEQYYCHLVHLSFLFSTSLLSVLWRAGQNDLSAFDGTHLWLPQDWITVIWLFYQITLSTLPMTSDGGLKVLQLHH